MSDRKAKQYNLRSIKQEQVHILVHKQSCDDREFLSKMLGKQTDPADVLESDLSASDSEPDCSDLLSQSDNEDNSSQTDTRTYKETLKTPLNFKEA